MADVLGAVSSAITIVETCAKIVAYIREVKDGSNERTRLWMEVISTKGILESLIVTVRDGEEETWSETIRTIHHKNGPLDLLHVVLTAILDKLVQAARAKGVVKLSNSLKWPFTKKDIEEQLKTIDRLKLLLTLALENDHVALSREIQSDTKAIRNTVAVIQTDVADMRSDLEQRQQREQQTEVLDWLSKVDYVPQQNDFISIREPGTGQWLLESEEFKSWVKTAKQTLFCPGIPGAGKTILTSVVIDHLTTQFQDNKSIAIAYLYCNFRRKDEQNAIDLLSSLLRQLAFANAGQPALPESVQLLYEKHGLKQTRPSVAEILSTLESVAALYARVFVMIDALDECQAVEANQFLAKTFKLQTNSGLNIFATSRHVPEIMDMFEGAVLLEIRATAEDVGRFVDGHMSHLPSFVRRSAELQGEVKTAIIEAVDGMFLLAQLYLNSLIGKRSPKAIRAALTKLPSGSESSAYDRAYDEAMERIQGQVADQEELAKQVLMWISCAPRMLLVEELQHALAVEIGTSNFDEDNLPDIEDMVSICAGLVVVDEESDVVRLVHYTTQHYFERTQSRWFPDGNGVIASSCITYLSYNDFESGFCETVGEFEERLKQHKLYEYAACHWGYHARQSSTVTRQVLGFLRCTPKLHAASQGMFGSTKTLDGSAYHIRRFGDQMTGLHVAACFGFNENILQHLLDDQGSAGPDVRDALGRTPLLWAARTGHTHVVQYLVDKGAGVGSEDNLGCTPLWFATLQGHQAVIHCLLDRGADIDVRNGMGTSPLRWAARVGQESTARLLLDRGANVESRDNIGYTPLMMVARSDQVSLPLAQLLLDHGANIEATNEDSMTALMLAALHGSEAGVKLMLAKGAEVNHRNINAGQTALSFAAEEGHQAIVTLLLSHPSTDPDLRDNIGRTPLSHAVENDHAEVVRALVGHSQVNPNHQDFYGNTPLLVAAAKESLGAVKALLATGRVDVNMANSFGRRPLWWARRLGNGTLEDLLLEYRNKNGILLYDADLPVKLVGRWGSDELGTCDVCTLPLIRESTVHYTCESCNGGNFDICLECYQLGARCLTEGHELVVTDDESHDTESE